jgi:predicted amidohydrolase YtcJ
MSDPAELTAEWRAGSRTILRQFAPRPCPGRKGPSALDLHRPTPSGRGVPHRPWGGERLRFGAMKLTCGGSISERMAQPDDRGILVTGEDEPYARARAAHQADRQVGVRANGDEAIDITLRVFERLQRDTISAEA